MQSIEWRAVIGYEGSYEVSSLGQVRSLDRVLHDGHRWSGRNLKLVSRLHHDGMPRVQVTLHLGGRQRTRLVHHLVLESFVGLRPDGTEACHWDGDSSNNDISNLRWATHAENEGDKKRHGTHGNSVKTHCPSAHLLSLPNLVLGELRKGGRKCRACNQARSFANKRNLPFDSSVADERYRLIMGARS